MYIAYIIWMRDQCSNNSGGVGEDCVLWIVVDG